MRIWDSRQEKRLQETDRPGGALRILAPVLMICAIACGGGDEFRESSASNGMIVPAASMKSARSGHTATLLSNGDVLIAGGMDGNGRYYGSVEIYSPATDSFRPAKGMSMSRVGHTATTLPDGRVLIAGGYNRDYLGSAEIYDPATGGFAPTGQMTMARSEHVAVLLDDGKVLLAGGIGVGWTFLASADLYDPSTGTFTSTGSMSTPRESHTATRLRSGKVLISGGHKGRREAMTVYSSAELYDPANGTFSPTGNMTTIRHKHAAALLPDGRVLIVGGSDTRDWQGEYRSAEIYDPARGKFTAVGEMKRARFKIAGAIVLLNDGKVLIAGGGEKAELYEPETNTFSLVNGELDTARFFSAVTLLKDGRVLITGGYDRHNRAGARGWLYKN